MDLEKILKTCKKIEGDLAFDYYISRKGKVYNLSTGIKIKPYKQRYLSIVLIYKDGNRKRKYIHRLVALAFVPNPENKPQVNHIDGNKKNNYYLNLEWVTAKENTKHAIDKNLRKDNTGPNNNTSKISEQDFEDIKKLGKHHTSKSIGDRYNLSKSQINKIISGRTWKSRLN